jgi:ferrochelatase
MKTAVLLMAYGSPTSMNDVPEYLKGIYEGRPVPEYALRENREKYGMVNGTSPSNGIIESVTDKLRERFRHDKVGIFLGNKHWKPWISDVVGTIASEGYERILAIPLFPFPSHNVVESYARPLNEIVEREAPNISLSIVNRLDSSGIFSRMWSDLITATEGFDDWNNQIIFTAHSLPNSVNDESGYDTAFRNAAERISKEAGIGDYLCAYQSMGKYGKRWLDPSVYDVLPSVASSGKKGVITVPIGFLYTHLEVLYDLDYEFGGFVKRSGMNYSRVPLPDDGTPYIDLLSDTINKGINCDYT